MLGGNSLTKNYNTSYTSIVFDLTYYAPLHVSSCILVSSTHFFDKGRFSSLLGENDSAPCHMPVLVKLPDGGSPPQWGVIELQGDLESRGYDTFSSEFIGDLHYTSTNVPVLIVGHHILYGKEVSLEKPFAVLEKHTDTCEGKSECPGVSHEKDTCRQTHYIVKAVIKKKLLFKTRPKPIIANVAKCV